MPGNIKVLSDIPNSLRFSKTTNQVNLLVKGQGVILFETKEATRFSFVNNDASDGLTVSLTAEKFLVERMSTKNKYESQGKTGGLTTKSGAYYWFSLDSQNQIFQAGVGEPRVETVCYVYKFDPTDKLWELNKGLSLIHI